MSDDIRDSLSSLKSMNGVIGICLHCGPNLIENLFPRAFSQSRVEQFCTHIDEFAVAYEQAGRPFTEICLKFNGGTIYTVGYAGNRVSFLLEDSNTTPLLGTAANTFLKDNADKINLPKPAPRTSKTTLSLNTAMWDDFHEDLAHVIGKVIGTASSEKLISRVLKTMGSDTKTGLPPMRFRELGLAIVLEIPNRSKQSILRKELETLLDK